MNRCDVVNACVAKLIETHDSDAVLLDIRDFIDNHYDGESIPCVAFSNLFCEIKQRVKAQVGDAAEWLEAFTQPKDVTEAKQKYTCEKTEERIKDQIHYTWEQVNALVNAAEDEVRNLPENMDVSRSYAVVGALQLLTGRRISELTEGRVFAVAGPHMLTINQLSKKKRGPAEHTFPTIIDANVCFAALEAIRGLAKNDPKAIKRGRRRVFGDTPLDHNTTRGLYCHVLFDRRNRIGFGVGWGFIVFCKEALGHSTMGGSLPYQRITMEE